MEIFGRLFKQAVREAAATPNRRLDPESEVDERVEIRRTTEPDVDAYYAYLEAIRVLHSKRQITRMLERCKASLPLLPALVIDNERERQEYGPDSCLGEAFCLTIPALDQGLRYWSALGDLASLGQAIDAIRGTPEVMAVYGDAAERALNDAKLSARLRDYLRENPGALQSETGKALGVSGRETTRIITSLRNLGMIERNPCGKTYELRLVESRAGQ